MAPSGLRETMLAAQAPQSIMPVDDDTNLPPGAISPRLGSVTPRAGSEAGEDMMQDFVSLHMMSILQPFSERLHELQAEVQQHASELLKARQLAESHETSINSHAQELAGLQGGAAAACKALEAAQAELAATKRERNRLEGNHEMTKATLGKTKETLESISSSVVALQQSSKDCHGKISSIETALADSEKKITEEMELRLNKQGRACKDLVERQAEVMKACEHSKALGERAHAALKKLTNEHESQKREDGSSLAGLQEWATNLDAKLAGVDQEVQRQADKAKLTDKEVQHLKTWTKQLDDIGQMHTKQTEAGALLEAQALRLQKAELDMAAIRKEAVAQQELHNTDLCGLEKSIDKSIADTARWMDTQKAHVDLISSAGRRLQDLEIGQNKLELFAESSGLELRGLSAWRQDVLQDLESHGAKLEATRVALSSAQEGVDGASDSLRGLREEFSAEKELLAKLRARVDQCYKYFNGLGKGLQDTQRQVLSAEGGMLPPKLGGGTMLPTLPVAPRTPRSNLPTPRKTKALT